MLQALLLAVALSLAPALSETAPAAPTPAPQAIPTFPSLRVVPTGEARAIAFFARSTRTAQ